MMRERGKMKRHDKRAKVDSEKQVGKGNVEKAE